MVPIVLLFRTSAPSLAMSVTWRVLWWNGKFLFPVVNGSWVSTIVDLSVWVHYPCSHFFSQPLPTQTTMGHSQTKVIVIVTPLHYSRSYTTVTIVPHYTTVMSILHYTTVTQHTPLHHSNRCPIILQKELHHVTLQSHLYPITPQ